MDYQKIFKELFVRVQNELENEREFEDAKTFPDCICRISHKKIQKKYNEQKNKEGFNLKSFVLENFELPKTYAIDFENEKSYLPVKEYIHKLWDVLTRQPDTEKDSSLIPLQYSYIVPGGRFREIYYWDSYFTMLGLQLNKKYELIENMVKKFSDLINEYGFIPNGNRCYYKTRSQPPFFCLMVHLLAEVKENKTRKEVLIEYLPQIEKEYNFWMDGAKDKLNKQKSYHRVVCIDDNVILNRYWDNEKNKDNKNSMPRTESYRKDKDISKRSGREPTEIYLDIRAACESGWDFSSRWFKDGKSRETIHTTEIIPVDLNCLLYYMEKTLADIYALKKKEKEQKYYSKKAKERENAIHKYCWNEKEQFFMDYDFVAKENTKIYSLAALYPLFFKIATKEQAILVAERIKKDFLKPGGLVTTLSKNTNEQWDYPIGWAPLHWISITGLRNYDLNDLANKIRDNWVKLNQQVYQDTGKLVEKYNVIDKTAGDNTSVAQVGFGQAQIGFGWTNGVLLKLMSERTL